MEPNVAPAHTVCDQEKGPPSCGAHSVVSRLQTEIQGAVTKPTRTYPLATYILLPGK